MKKFIIIFIMSLMAMVACQRTPKQPNFYEISDGIINYEVSRLPLIIQSVGFVEDISIDSLVFIQTSIEPYKGYLVTNVRYTRPRSTWKIDTVDTLSTRCLIQIDSIITNKTSYQWQTNWGALYTINH